MNARKLVTASRSALAIALYLVVAISAYGQVEAGRFVGRIEDPQGAVVANATVRATNMGTNIVQTAVTDSTGDFVITPVSAGVYSLTVAAGGFETVNTSNIEVQVGQIVREDLHLKIGSST